jgi:hypothetical protein
MQGSVVHEIPFAGKEVVHEIQCAGKVFGRMNWRLDKEATVGLRLS